MTVVVAGEALMDLVVDARGAVAAHPGGGPFNVARGVARLGRPSAFLGRLSTDVFGRRLRAALEADGVALDLVEETDDPTTLALFDGGYRFYTQGTSAPGLTAAGLPPATSALCVGSLSLVLEPIGTALEALATGAGPETLVAVDPNIRPAVHTQRDRPRLDRVLARADVVKASLEDLAWLAPGAGPVEAARSLAPAVVITLGERGALVVTADGAVEVEPPVVEVVDTIGAGDAFMGALLARGLSRADLSDPGALVAAARFACEVAADACTRAGA